MPLKLHSNTNTTTFKLRNENNAGSFYVRKGPPDIVRDGLVLHLDAANPYSYVSGSSNWFDLTGNTNNTGLLANGPVFSGDNGGSIVFDGVDDIVRVGTGYPLPLGTNDVTINVWSKITTNDGAERHHFGTVLRLYGSYNAGYSGNKMYAALGNNPGSNPFYFPVYGTATTLPLNTWIMTTTVMDRSSDIKLYFNGEIEPTSGSIDISSADGVYLSASLFGLWVGGVAFRSPARLHQGNISLVQVYFRTLSAEEVKQNYDAIKGRYGL
jgi:hypothetical protein